ncbi:fimbrial biogenesis chaperone [Sphingomonas sp. CCH15-F11]|uniref:fimbrial biogenesis chaperone n=1 Tax=Sphingomonas sp. CCH15-F11 TaxID=1768785 RepID=UPI0009E6B252|nr:fimbria/pilus periplasmic chaperone [Sphingomonas sp. CCH15-F11]
MLATRLRGVAFACALLATVCSAAPSYAYEVGPLRIFLVPAEGRNQSSLSVNNDRDEPLPIEMKVFKRLTARDGSEQLIPADGDFIIFPPQTQVAAKSSQSIRMQYVGEPVVLESVCYVVQVTEVPVIPPGFSGVRFAYNFGAAVYVEPARAAAKLGVTGVERIDGGIRLIIRNAGNKHVLLQHQRLTITADDQKLELTGSDLAQRVDNPTLPPNMERVIDIKSPELRGTGQVMAEIRAGTGA